MLGEDMTRTCAQFLSTSMEEDFPEHWEKVYHSLVLQGEIFSTVCYITEREKGGVFQPEDICPKKSKPVLEVL